MMTFTGSRWRWKMEIIKVRNAEYSRYEELLLERDRLRKEARIYHGLYVKEFGELHLSLFEKQINCIKKKKMIGYYQMAINCGGVIDQAEIDALLTKEMEEYQQKLHSHEGDGGVSEKASADAGRKQRRKRDEGDLFSETSEDQENLPPAGKAAASGY